MALTSTLGSATLNYQLTSYAQGLWNDLADVTRLAERLAPTTPVPGAVGQFKKFDDANSFNIVPTPRAIGGDPALMAFGATDDTYSCKPQALEVRVDKIEMEQAGDRAGEVGLQLLREGKIRALLNKTALSHVYDVVAAVAAGTTASSGVGNWSNPDIDPIDQLDSELLTLSKNCGSTQNIKLTMDIGSWNALRNHPKVKTRTQFTQVQNLTQEQLSQILIIPVDVMVANVVYNAAALNQTVSKKRVLDSLCYLHYSLPGATIYDPSAFKSFTVGNNMPIGNVYSYTAPNQLWEGHLVEWTRDIKATSSLSIRKIAVT